VQGISVSFSLYVAIISSTVLRTSKFVTYFICLQSHLVLSLLRHDSFDPLRSELILHTTPHQTYFIMPEFQNSRTHMLEWNRIFHT
jgi:exosortase/archaeosortase